MIVRPVLLKVNIKLSPKYKIFVSEIFLVTCFHYSYDKKKGIIIIVT